MTEAGARRKVTQVAVGVLLRDDGCVLLADRPDGKPYAGYWEFPGGKIEPGEPVSRALERELHEELGIDIGPSVPWVSFKFDYPHAYVELQFRLVRRWRGEPHAREGQRLRFVRPTGELPQPLLPAAVPALRWLRLPSSALVATTGDIDLAARLQMSRGAPRLIVVAADWRGDDGAGALASLRGAIGGSRDLILVSGPGAQRVTGADGVIAQGAEPAPVAEKRWRGRWIDSMDELRDVSPDTCDFILVRSASVAQALREGAAAVPAYLPQEPAADAGSLLNAPRAHGSWTDVRGRCGLRQ